MLEEPGDHFGWKRIAFQGVDRDEWQAWFQTVKGRGNKIGNVDFIPWRAGEGFLVKT